jgi:hypothetical protein
MSTTYRSPAALCPAPAFRRLGWELAFWGAILAVTLTRVVAGFVRPGPFGAEPTVALLVSAGLVFLIGQDLAAHRQSRARGA